MDQTSSPTRKHLRSACLRYQATAISVSIQTRPARTMKNGPPQRIPNKEPPNPARDATRPRHLQRPPQPHQIFVQRYARSAHPNRLTLRTPPRARRRNWRTTAEAGLRPAPTAPTTPPPRKTPQVLHLPPPSSPRLLHLEAITAAHPPRSRPRPSSNPHQSAPPRTMGSPSLNPPSLKRLHFPHHLLLPTHAP
jgi:hypothetical protein